MSEPMFPSPESSQAAPAVGAPVAEGGNKKALLAVGGIAAALVVGAGAFFLLNSGGSSDPAPVAAQPQAAAPEAAAPSAAPSAKPVVRPAAASVTGRDPFKALFVVAAAGDAGTTTTGGSTSGTSGGSTSSSGGTTTTPVPAPAPAAPSVTLAVSKVDVANQTATVSVDGKKYATSVDVPFGKYYTVYGIFNDSCVGILYGDQSVAVCASKPMTVTP